MSIHYETRIEKVRRQLHAARARYVALLDVEGAAVERALWAGRIVTLESVHDDLRCVQARGLDMSKITAELRKKPPNADHTSMKTSVLIIFLLFVYTASVSAQPGAPWRSWDPHHLLYNPPTYSSAPPAPQPEAPTWVLLLSLGAMTLPVFVALFRWYVLGKRHK